MDIENSVLLLIGFLFLSLAYYYVKKPPKEINHLYGYRTRRSMCNQEVWDFANKQNAKYFWRVALFTMGISVLLLFFDIPFKMMIQMGVLLISLGISVWNTEKELNKHFDKNGNKRS